MAYYGENHAWHSAQRSQLNGKTLKYSQVRRLSLEEQKEYVGTRKVIFRENGSTYHYIGKCPTRGRVWAKLGPDTKDGVGPTYYFSPNIERKDFNPNLWR